MTHRNHATNLGQATTEYILLLAITVGLIAAFSGWVRDSNLQGKIAKPIQDGFRRTYQYGHPKVKGPEESGGPEHHALIDTGDNNNFRIFLNPGRRE